MGLGAPHHESDAHPKIRFESRREIQPRQPARHLHGLVLASPRAMGTAAPVAHAEALGESPAIAFLHRLWKWLWPPNAELAPTNEAEVPVLTLLDPLRKFLWLSSRLFSSAAVAASAIGVVAY